MDRGEGMDVMDWDWIIEGERATEGRRGRRVRRLHARRARHVFRPIDDDTVAACQFDDGDDGAHGPTDAAAAALADLSNHDHTEEGPPSS